jgi:hypothetical protein
MSGAARAVPSNRAGSASVSASAGHFGEPATAATDISRANAALRQGEKCMMTE